MLALRRHFHFKSESSEHGLAAYDRLCTELRTAVQENMGGDERELSSWPDGEWTVGDQKISVTDWKGDPGSTVRLLQLAWQDQRDGITWSLDLAIGWHASEVVSVAEVWQVDSQNRFVAYETLPPITNFLTRADVLNEDGRQANVCMVVQQDRVGAFVSFIGSEDRRLPVILLAPRPNDADREIGQTLVERVRGLAHVIRLSRAAEGAFQSAMPLHKCYDGAIRLYMPGFQSSDKPWLHPFWLLTVNSHDAMHEILDRVARESVVIDADPVLQSLLARRDEFRRQEAQRSRSEAVREAQGRRKAESEAELYTQMASQQVQQIENLTARTEMLETENLELRDKVRRLKWQLNQIRLSEPIEQPAGGAARLLLSGRASESYEALDDGERAYWDDHVLRKLLEDELREHQSEPVKSTGEPCFVYPRARSGDGRRVIYYADGDDIYVCELLLSADHDRRYSDKRTHGVSRSAYASFTPWTGMSEAQEKADGV